MNPNAGRVVAVERATRPQERLGRVEQAALPFRHPDGDIEREGPVVPAALVAVMVGMGNGDDLADAGGVERVEDRTGTKIDQETHIACRPQEHVAGVAVPPQRRRQLHQPTRRGMVVSSITS